MKRRGVRALFTVFLLKYNGGAEWCRSLARGHQAPGEKAKHF